MTAPDSPEPQAPGVLHSHLRAVVAQSWSAVQPLPALYCAPGVALALALGLMAGNPGAALLGAAGAFSAGFGAFQRLTRFHATPMLLATLCMAIATAIGTVASGLPLLDAAIVAAAAFSLGLGAAFGTGPWWVLLQGAVFLIIAGAHPAGWSDGFTRAAIVLAGGVGQTVLIGMLRTVAPRGFPPLQGPNAVAAPESRAAWIAEARRVFAPSSDEFRYALLLGLAAGAAILLARSLALPNGYWAALTVVLVLRRGGAETINRGLQRIGGTILGAAAATLIAALLRPDPLLLIVLISASAWCAYATQWVNYGTFSVSVTSYVAFLMALIGTTEAELAVHRVIATLIGGAIGVGALALAQVGRHARRVFPS